MITAQSSINESIRLLSKVRSVSASSAICKHSDINKSSSFGGLLLFLDILQRMQNELLDEILFTLEARTEVTTKQDFQKLANAIYRTYDVK